MGGGGEGRGPLCGRGRVSLVVVVGAVEGGPGGEQAGHAATVGMAGGQVEGRAATRPHTIHLPQRVRVWGSEGVGE